MLTRLKVNGFKNLVNVDVRFGPFTCIAGVNGSGKSNLFDAIRFLSLLAQDELKDAAQSVRGEGGRSADIRSLFHWVGDEYAKEMSFEAEMIVPAKGKNDLGQVKEAGNTFLRYGLTLRYRPDRRFPPDSPIIGERGHRAGGVACTTGDALVAGASTRSVSHTQARRFHSTEPHRR